MAAWNSMVYRLVLNTMNKIDFENENQLIINIANFIRIDKIFKTNNKTRLDKNIRNINTLKHNNLKNSNKRTVIIFIPHNSNII